MTVIYADKVLMPDGWHKDVHVHIDRDGRIAEVYIGHAKADVKIDVKSGDLTHVSCLLPAPVNAHSHAFQRAIAA